ncbi:MAG: ATP-binding protein [Bacteroidetes bacterium]|nr:ATP-binding protein [Bacteroidota bacterium]
MINRNIGTTIKDACRYFSVITVTGPRQSGKTTLIKQLFPDFQYHTLENPDTKLLALNDPLGFLQSHTAGVILDEVQNAPELFSYIQGLVDENRERKFILSGSSNFALMKNISQSLAGRTAIFELLPLSFGEIASLTQHKTIDEILFDGFYPAIYSGEKTPQLLYQNYVKTYLDRDVRDLLNVKDMTQFHTFIRLCAGRIGSLFNASELANEVGISVKTITAWLSVLQASYIIYMLPPYFENINKRLTKQQKLYFTDTGLACYLLDIENATQLNRDKMRGHLFENFVVMDFLKNRYNMGKESNLYFYRDSNKNEVDLLQRTGNNFEITEIKSSMTYSPDFEKGLKYFSNIFENRVTNKQIIYCGELEKTSGDIKLLNFSRL